jgi:hypothetical protein
MKYLSAFLQGILHRSISGYRPMIPCVGGTDGIDSGDGAYLAIVEDDELKTQNIYVDRRLCSPVIYVYAGVGVIFANSNFRFKKRRCPTTIIDRGLPPLRNPLLQ